MNIDNQISLLNIAQRTRLNNLVKAMSTPTFTGFKLHKRYKYQGMDISIENKKGSYRHWKDEQGNTGKSLMHCDYGYIRRTLGNDGDHIDCFVNANNVSDKVFVIHQNNPNTGKFDEDKVMLGCDDAKQAKSLYLKHYDNSKFFGSIIMLDIKEFKKKVLGKTVNKIK